MNICTFQAYLTMNWYYAALLCFFIIFIVIIGIVVSLILKNYNDKFEKILNDKDDINTVVKYYRLDGLSYNKPSLKTFETFINAFAKQGLQLKQAVKYDDCIFVQFDSLNNIDEYMKKFNPSKRMTHVYGVLGTDFMASKSALAYTLKAAGMHDILPKTYITNNEDDMKELGTILSTTTNSINKPYILKKNLQRQEGQEISNDRDYILKSASDYVVVQEMLQNPLLINGHKCNMRIYLLVVLRPNNNNNIFAIYDNGFMYYTPKAFVKNSINKDEVITTGYIARSIYVKNPLTHKDIQEFIGKERYGILHYNIIDLAKKVRSAYYDMLVSYNNEIPGTKFLIYGMDIAPDNNLGVTLMEINKGPDLSYKDERDKEVKLNMVHKAMGLAGLYKFDSSNNGSDCFIVL